MGRGSVAETGFDLTWDRCEQSDWTALLARVGRSSLEQSWPYGEGIAHAGKARVRRGVVTREDEPIALVQVFEKRLPVPVTQARILRGPLFLDPAPSRETLGAVFGLVRAEYRLRRGRLLFWQPELEDGPDEHGHLTACGLRRTVTGYATLMLDLERPEDALRSGLRGPWRRAMASAEKAGLRVQIASGGPPFEWLIGEVDEHRRKGGYFAPSAVQLRTMVASCLRKEAEVLAVIGSQGAPVAGVLVLVHGQTATYVAGWSGPEGRTLSASHLLLWRAILALKKRGVRWLDLGGITAAAPGVARFKIGTGGSLLTLVGTYL